MTSDRDGCPSWCAHHTPARCRSKPVPVQVCRGVPFALQLERWNGRETVLAVLPAPDHVGPLLLPMSLVSGFLATVDGVERAAPVPRQRGRVVL